jgi:hypothetical protein
VHILSSRTKTWVTDVKMSLDQHLTALCWWNENVLCGAAGGGNICLWDIRMTGSGGRVLSWSVFPKPSFLTTSSPPSLSLLCSFRHDEGSYISALAVNRYHTSQDSSASQKYLAVGGESGVVSVYDMLSTSATDGTAPIKVKDVMNLTTKVSSMSLHPSGKLLAIGSDQKKDQLRMVHLPSCSVYGNWPTSRTPLGKVRCVDFSQGCHSLLSSRLTDFLTAVDGSYLVQGDHRGKAYLYRIE